MATQHAVVLEEELFRRLRDYVHGQGLAFWVPEEALIRAVVNVAVFWQLGNALDGSLDFSGMLEDYAKHVLPGKQKTVRRHRDRAHSGKRRER